MIDCIVHNVPFPAYETFEDRQNLPRRFFLFFDKFFKAGRHNKNLWNAALERNKGRNNISFGTCIFEAHVRTTIRENYFTWMYQALASPRIIQVLEKADDFKTEYDFDELPDELACGCPFISDLPLSCEIYYNTAMNVYETIALTSQANALQVEQRKRLQEIIDKNKEERKQTLKILRDMIDVVRPKYLNYNKEEKKEFNMDAKRTFKLFLDSDKENNEGTAPPNKKQKRPVPQNKCRVTSEKLDVFKAVTNQMLQEKQSGIRSAWERVYKQVVNEFVAESSDNGAAHKPEDFLLELEELENDWKTQSSLEHDGLDGGSVLQVDAV
jgi:hypothetical protein